MYAISIYVKFEVELEFELELCYIETPLPCEHAEICQNWADISLMLAESGLYWHSSGTLHHVYRVYKGLQRI